MSNKTDIPAPTEEHRLVSIRALAVALLARREHSRWELWHKLTQRFSDEPLVEQVIARLEEEKLQSDERFAEVFVTTRLRKGQGPVRIAMELRQKGIGDDLCEQYLDIDEEEWIAMARQVWQKRFAGCGDDAAQSRTASMDNTADKKQRLKQMRFLQYRGFTTAQINKVLA